MEDDEVRVVTAKQMKQIELNSLDYGLTFQRLMENAGSAAAAFIRRTFKIEGRNCVIFCARGNNGGDGFVVARKLMENDANVLVVLLDGAPASDEARFMYEQLELLEAPVHHFDQIRDKLDGWLEQTDLVVDAICGTGFRGELREAHREACGLINDCIAAVVSLDLPTGVECDTGRVASGAVKADFTLAFDSLKPLHTLPSSLPCCGQIEVLDIGIPPEAREGTDYLCDSLDEEQVFALLKPRRLDSHKGDYGRVINVAGSANYRGAALLSTMAALRCGAGIVTLASIEPVCAAAAVKAPEATLLPLAHCELGVIDSSLPLTALADALKSAASVLFGCGMGNNLHTSRLLEYVLQNTTCPVVIDADGINALAGNINVLKEAKALVTLTPHPGEMARLCGLDVAKVQEDRPRVAQEFSRKHNVVVVLKGHGTLIAAPDGSLVKSETGNPGLSKGGSGDVLAGMIAALLAQGMPPASAAACGVYLHGLAADRTAGRLSQTAMLPGDILEDLAGIFLAHGR